MPRPRKNAPAGNQLSHGQASYVLDRLLKDRHISQYDVQRYVNDMGREITELQARLDSLRQAHGGAGTGTGTGGGAAAPARRRGRPGRPPGRPGRPPGRPGRPPGRPGRPPGRPPASAGAAPAGAAAGAATSKKTRKRRSAITPEQLASRQLQGRYLALIRQIPANKRGQYQKTAKEKGREAAIKEMQDAVKK